MCKMTGRLKTIIYTLCIFFIMQCINVSLTGPSGIIFALAFTVYNIAIMLYTRMTGLQIALFMVSDCIYSFVQFGQSPYFNITVYSIALMYEILMTMKDNGKLLNRLKSPTATMNIGGNAKLMLQLVFVQAVSVMIASDLKTLQDAGEQLSLHILIFLSSIKVLQILVPLAIALHAKCAKLFIFAVYTIGLLNTLQMMIYGSVDILQIVETAYVYITLFIQSETIRNAVNSVKD